ncbi:MAG: transporter substrate-binding domain-containing protein [Vicingaceae bacterium]
MLRFLLFFALGLFLNFQAFSNQIDSLTQNEGQGIKIGYKNSPPFVYTDESGQMQGISVFLIEEMARDLSLPIQYKSYELDELIEAVEKGEVDLSINPLTVTEGRLRKMKFSQPFAISNLAIVAHTEQESQILLFIKNIFSLNFLKAVLLLFLVIFIFGFFIWLFEKGKNPHFEKGGKGIFSGIWFSAVTMTTVGYGDKSPLTTGGKLTTLIWMFTALIIISGFTASIAASLTVGQLDSEIQNLSDLKELTVGTIEASSSESYLHKNRIDAKTYLTVAEGLQALDKGKLQAFVYDEPLLRYYLQKEDYESPLKVLPLHLNRQYYSFAFPKGSKLLDQLNPELIRLIGTEKWNEQVMQFGIGE